MLTEEGEAQAEGMPSFIHLQIQDSLSDSREQGEEREGLWIAVTVTGIFMTG